MGPLRCRRAPESLRHPPPSQPSARCHQPRGVSLQALRAGAGSGGRVPAAAQEPRVRPESKLVSQIRPVDHAARDWPAQAKARTRESAVPPREDPGSRESHPAAGSGGGSRGLQLDPPPGGDWGGGAGRGLEEEELSPSNGAAAQRRRG